MACDITRHFCLYRVVRKAACLLALFGEVAVEDAMVAIDLP